MVGMINAWTHTEMFVAEDRVNEYLAAGCVLAADSVTVKADPVKEETKKAEEPKKTTTKKAPAKKTTTAKKK